MRHDFKRGELVVTIKDEIYPKGSIGMVTELFIPDPDGKEIQDVDCIQVLWFNYKFPNRRQKGWVKIDWVKRFEKENK